MQLCNRNDSVTCHDIVPDDFKVANVILVLKKGKPEADLENHRIISVITFYMHAGYESVGQKSNTAEKARLRII